MLTTTFENKVLVVYRDGTALVTQPFKPTSTGDRPEWTNEQEALDWFATDCYKLVATKEEVDELIAAQDSSNTD